MELGLFSMSLAVSDLEASSAFYAKLGFEEMAGDGEHYLIMVNNGSVVGLFQDMFERNILTFNPGWRRPEDAAGDPPEDPFLDVREIAARLESEGLELTTRSIAGESGPGHIVVLDPDGNPVLIDQHR